MAKKLNSKLVHDFLDKNDWKYRYIPKMELYFGHVVLRSCISLIEFLICICDTHVTGYFKLPVSAKECLRPMAEFLTRANYGLNFGCFELDFNTGEIRYKMSVSNTALEANPNEEMRRLMAVPCEMIDLYSSGIIGVLSGYVGPEDAVKKCEEK